MWHVSDPFTGHAAAFGSGFAAENVNLARVESPSADDTAEECRLAATAGPQQTVSVTNRKGNQVRPTGTGEKCSN